MNRIRTLAAEFTFHNVGHGLFYSGRIGDFNFVYDCGSRKKGQIQSAVREFKRNILRKSNIDMLVLSHLHADHISGLDILLDKTGVNTVFLPYLLPEERLMVALQDENPSVSLRSFWSDPLSFLYKKNVGRIILFGTNEASPPEDVSDQYEEGRMDINRLLKDEKLESQIRDSESESVSRLLDTNKLFAKRHDRNLPIGNGWFFRFFNLHQKDSRQQRFERCVRRTFPNEDLIDIIKDKSKLEKLRTCYDMLRGEFNNTSLVIYHGPITSSLHQMNQCNTCSRISFRRTWQSPNRLSIQLHRVIGHLLTGDVNFGNWTEIARHYSSYLSRVDLALVPHHGSRRSWNRVALNDIVDACWVASAGISSKPRHPNSNVCRDITNAGSDLQCANEVTEVISCGRFHT